MHPRTPYVREWTKRRVASGLCLTCQNQAAPGSRYCSTHRDRQRRRLRQWYLSHFERKKDYIYGRITTLIVTLAQGKSEISWQDLVPPLERTQATSTLNMLLRRGVLLRTKLGNGGSRTPGRFRLNPKRSPMRQKS